MILPTLLLSAFSALSLILVMGTVFDAWEVGVRLGGLASAFWCAYAGVGQYYVLKHTAQSQIERVRYRPLIVERIVEHALVSPALPPVPSLNTGETRSIVLNANGEQTHLTLDTPSPLVTFLDACISLVGRDSVRFPTVRALERVGVKYDSYDQCLSLLGTRVSRTNRTPTLVRGTLGELRDSL